MVGDVLGAEAEAEGGGGRGWGGWVEGWVGGHEEEEEEEERKMAGRVPSNVMVVG